MRFRTRRRDGRRCHRRSRCPGPFRRPPSRSSSPAVLAHRTDTCRTRCLRGVIENSRFSASYGERVGGCTGSGCPPRRRPPSKSSCDSWRRRTRWTAARGFRPRSSSCSTSAIGSRMRHNRTPGCRPLVSVAVSRRFTPSYPNVWVPGRPRSRDRVAGQVAVVRGAGVLVTQRHPLGGARQTWSFPPT